MTTENEKETALPRKEEVDMVASINKITALSVLLKNFEPDSDSNLWAVYNGISHILDEIGTECFKFFENVSEGSK
ncbi:hypothetical protein K7I13_02965 [Brucepastera parasyntrophica]|uniref:hypothetical protein n=1 Tax=Brucepastera parasyntrophica TaxID=2880008 RepID=UPI00210D968F|nr:hypothetical protein [Brucepastera parasyntrophica]ULQ60289.1 hypothetical protein K7I13_02965 [Brucepastera parasyntrophica]